MMTGLVDGFWRVLRGERSRGDAEARSDEGRQAETLSGPINSANQFLVVPHGDLFVQFSLPGWACSTSTPARVVLTRKEALRLGAWLLAIADPEGTAAERMKERIKAR